MTFTVEELLSSLAIEKNRNNILCRENEDLSIINKDLSSRKKFGLVWENSVDEQAALLLNNIPVIVEDRDRAVVTAENQQNHVLISSYKRR